MARLFNLLAWAASAAAIMAIASFIFWYHAYPSRDISWTSQLYQKKFAQLAGEDDSAPRILLTGGSSVHFGFSAQHLSEKLGMPAFNLGSHASLGPRMHLHLAKKVLRPGDTLVLVIEYENLLSSWSPNDFLKDYVRLFEAAYPVGIEGYFSPRLFAYFRSRIFEAVGVERILSWREWLTPTPTTDSVVRRTSIAQAPLGPQYTSPYDLEHIDAWGDQTEKRTELIAPPLRVNPEQPVFDIEEISPVLLNDLREFGRWADEHHVRFLVAWPPFLDRTALHSPAYQKFFSNAQSSFDRIDVQTLGSPSDYFLSFDQVLDTQYHANNAGSALLTDRLIEFWTTTD